MSSPAVVSPVHPPSGDLPGRVSEVGGQSFEVSACSKKHPARPLPELQSLKI